MNELIINTPINKKIQQFIVNDKYRELEFDTNKSNYYYNYKNLLIYLTVGDEFVINLNKNINTYYIASITDKDLGFCNDSLLSEPIIYESHFFYKENTNKINTQIIQFLHN
jgi:hypothetical protein